MTKTLAKTRKEDIRRLGIEMTLRGTKVWEHSAFGGIKANHMSGSKHYRDEAIDLNDDRRGSTSRLEDDRFDRLAPELVERKFGTIWNRGNNDHETHCHAETWGDPDQYPGRYRLKREQSWRKLKVDGTIGEQTWRAVQEWLGVASTGKISNSGSPTVMALQAYLNTELRGRLSLDGALGPKTIRALQHYLGTPVTGKYSDRGSTMWKEVQRRLNRRGHLAP